MTETNDNYMRRGATNEHCMTKHDSELHFMNLYNLGHKQSSRDHVNSHHN